MTAFVFRDFGAESDLQWAAMEVCSLDSAGHQKKKRTSEGIVQEASTVPAVHNLHPLSPLPVQGDVNAEDHRLHLLRRFLAALDDETYHVLLSYTYADSLDIVKRPAWPSARSDIAVERKEMLLALAGKDDRFRTLVSRRHPSWLA